MKLAISGNELVVSGLELFPSEKQFFINLQTINDALEKNGQLVSLNLSGNKIGDNEIKFILPILTQHFHVTSINLSNNNIGTIGALAIINFLKIINECLTSMDLSSNQLLPNDLYLMYKIHQEQGMNIKIDNNLENREGSLGPLVMASVRIEEAPKKLRMAGSFLMSSLNQFFTHVTNSTSNELTGSLSLQELSSDSKPPEIPQNPSFSDKPIRELPSPYKTYGTF
jgi:hypothetical protein